MTLSPVHAGAWAADVLRALGASPVDARQCAEHLLAAERAEHPSHGLRMLLSMAEAARLDELDPAAQPEVERVGPSLTKIDGRLALGPPVGRWATDEAVRLTRANGVSAVAVRGAGHMGRLAPYAERAASAGCVLIVCANDGGANQHVVPAGGLEGRLSTNPIAFGVPRPGEPHLVVDMATSAYAHGTLAALAEAGHALPVDGHVSGTELLRPMAAHKGFGLALVVEALAGALTGGTVVGPDPVPETQGALFVAIDVTALMPPDEFAAKVEGALGWVRSARPAGHCPVRIPGEGAVGHGVARVVIPHSLWTALMDLSQSLAVCPPTSEGEQEP